MCGLLWVDVGVFLRMFVCLSLCCWGCYGVGCCFFVSFVVFRFGYVCFGCCFVIWVLLAETVGLVVGYL